MKRLQALLGAEKLDEACRVELGPDSHPADARYCTRVTSLVAAMITKLRWLLLLGSIGVRKNPSRAGLYEGVKPVSTSPSWNSHRTLRPAPFAPGARAWIAAYCLGVSCKREGT